MQLVINDIPAKATQTLQNIRWDGKDATGKLLPAGEYTIRGVFNGAGFSIPADDFIVSVE